MDIKYLALMASCIILSGNVSAAEIYNKDGNKLDLYGLVSGLHYFSDDASQDGDQSYMRIGFKGQTQISDLITGYGQWQSQFNANQPESDSNSMFTRLGFAGIKVGSYGSFDYGRNTGVLYDALSLTDMQPEFDALTYNTDQFMFRRGNSLTTYRNSDLFGLIDGLDITLQYQGKMTATVSLALATCCVRTVTDMVCRFLTLLATGLRPWVLSQIPIVPVSRMAAAALWGAVTGQKPTLQR